MKRMIWIALLPLLFGTCAKKDAPKPKDWEGGNFVKFDVIGNQLNGDFEKNSEDGGTKIVAVLVGYPEQGGDPARTVANLFYNFDGDSKVAVYFKLPNAVTSTALMENDIAYEMGIRYLEDGVDGKVIDLLSKDVVVTVTDYADDGFYITRIRGTFKGVLVYKYQEWGGPLDPQYYTYEEPHPVTGSFQYRRTSD